MSGAPQNSHADDPIVSWRNGVHITGTQIWCDALRAREICFVSRADELSSPRHGQLIATQETLSLIDSGQRIRRPETELAVPYSRPFSLGTRRIELLRSGHSIGAASVCIDLQDRRVLYAGAVNRRGGGLGGTADLRSCTAVVLSADRARAGVRFEGAETTTARALELAAQVRDRGGVMVMLTSSAGRALDIASALTSESAAGHEISLAAHRSVHLAAQRLRRTGLALPALRRVTSRELANIAGRVLLWPVAARDALDDAELPAGSVVVLASGAAADPQELSAARAGHGLAWSGSADREDLESYIHDCGATDVYLTGRYAEELAPELSDQRCTVRSLGAPVQMSLFG